MRIVSAAARTVIVASAGISTATGTNATSRTASPSRRVLIVRDEHDPGHHREVHVGVGVARHLVLVAAGLGTGQPPRGHDRFPEGDDDDEPVALGEVVGRELPAFGAEEVRAAHVERERGRPQPALQPAVGERRGDEQPDADRRADRETDDGGAKERIVAAGEHEERDVGDADERVRDGEDERSVVEGIGHAEAYDEQRRHRGEMMSRTAPSSGSTTLVSHA